MKYRIEGNQLPVVICDLEAGEKMITESGSMSWMTSNMRMETVGGGFGKVFGRMFSGENLFQNHYTAVGRPGQIAFASSFPGSIRAFDIQPGRDIIVQKSSFLASEAGINFSVHFNKKASTGLFGGEGFIMQRLSGNGIAFVEIDGHAVEYNLGIGESMIVDTGYLAVMDATCSIEVVGVQGAKNVFFGGEGLFNTVVKGPGRIILQTMPIYKVAGELSRFFPSGD